MGNGDELLTVRGLTRHFYGVQALRGADFSVRRGTITALIGPNGAGKTTAFQCISGVIAPDGGTVRFDGQDITGWPADRITRAGLTRTFQIARGILRLSVLDNLLLYAPDQPGEGLVAALTGAGRAAEAANRARAMEVARRLNLLAVPLLALAGNWQIAVVLIVAERMGRGASGPAPPPVASTLCRCSTRPLS